MAHLLRVGVQPDEHRNGYYGYRGYGRGDEEIEWEYDNYDLKITFRRGSGGGWVVKEWDY